MGVYEATGAIVVAKQTDGSDVYLRPGEILPKGTTPEHIDHLLAMKMIRPFQGLVDAPAKKAAAAKKSSPSK